VDPYVQQDSALILLVSPDCDQHQVASAHRVVNHQTGRTDCSCVQKRLSEAIHRVAAVVLGHTDDLAGAFGRLTDAIAGAHGQTDRLLDHRVPASLYGFNGNCVVVAGRGGDVDSDYAHRLQQLHSLDDRGARSQAFFGVIGEGLGVGSNRVTGGHKLEGGEAGIVQLRQPVEVTMAHSTAANNCKRDLSHWCSFPCYRRLKSDRGQRQSIFVFDELRASCKEEKGSSNVDQGPEPAVRCRGIGELEADPVP